MHALEKIMAQAARVEKVVTGEIIQAQPLAPYVLKILAAGGIKFLIKMEYGQ